LQIDFVGLGFASGESLRYQFMLDGADKTWGEPTTQRSVNFANLAPGRYRFLVRAVNAAGVTSPTPAAVIFRILPPVWRRWWFVMLAVFFTGAFIYAIYRYRVARLLEVANMRTRIATDLHDDIGSNLTRIAILSEIVKQQSGNTSGRDQSKLASIADIARESVASMGDIVWAINPERDTLRDLKRRMRQHAEEVFSAHDIRLTFKASDEEQFKLGVDVRRDLFLIFKEAVNNAARHAQPAHVRIDLYREGTSIVLEVSDDGVGFDMTAESDGQGLTSIRRRAESLGAKLVFESHVGDGTRLLLKIPLARSRYFG
jgi:signal transduction histidine kinase